MHFDDHEIWGAPAQAAAKAEPEPTSAPAGRLYKSAACTEQVDAIVALPAHARHKTMVHPMTRAAQPVTQAPITINSQIPRPAAIEDPAIAEVLAAPVPAAPIEQSGFTSWFRRNESKAAPESTAAAPAPASGAPEKANLLGPAASVAGEVGARLAARTLTPPGYALLVFALASIAGAINAAVSGTVGVATGLVFLVACAVGAWALDVDHRWAGWVLPSYLLMAVGVVAGQFGDGAPGVSIVGQAMVVTSTLITLAPWLAVAAVVGVLMPMLRGKRN